MNPNISELIARIKELEDAIEAELDKRREELHFTIERHRVRFTEEVLARHRRLRIGLLQYLRQAKLRNIVSAPVIYAMFFPLLLTDIAVTFYQWTCFPLYGVPRVRRRDYFAYDRSSLAYLNILEKFNCTYCAYGNGLAAYLKEIVARTEQYWCPIKHARHILGRHSRYERFVDFGDAEAYRKEVESLRRDFET